MSELLRFPIGRTLDEPQNDPREEFLHACLDGHPPARQKRLLMIAARCEWMEDYDIGRLMDTYGLLHR